jgi:hypothetical protein
MRMPKAMASEPMEYTVSVIILRREVQTYRAKTLEEAERMANMFDSPDISEITIGGPGKPSRSVYNREHAPV